MKTILFLSFFLLFSLSLISQTNKYIDSLELVLNKTKDTSRISILKKIAWEYRGLNPDKSIKYANEIIIISNKFKLHKEKAAAYHLLSIIQIRVGNYQKALEFENKSLKIRESINDSSGVALSLSNIGNCYGYMGDLENANKIIRKSIKIAKEVKNLGVFANDLSYLSVNYIEMGKIDSALTFSLQSLKIFEDLKDLASISSSYQNIAALYSNLNKPEEAKKYLFKALDIKKKLSDKSQLAVIYSNLCIIYFHEKNIKKALEYSNMSVKLREDVKDISGLSESYNLIGVIYRFQKNYAKAIEYDQKALKIRKEIDDKYGMAETYYRIGISYQKMGELNKSIENLNKSIDIATEVGIKNQIFNSYNELAQTLYFKGDYKKAYQYHEKYSMLKDSVFSDNMQKQFAEMQTKYETEKKESEILLLNKDKQLKNTELLKRNIEVRKQRAIIYAFIIGFIIIVLFTIIIYRLYRQKRIANIILAQQKEEISAQRDEIETQRDLVTNQKEHIEEIHKEVTDSINYAKRIQEAVLPVSENARTVLGEHFILFKPKDIVSGDFYWTTKINNWLIVTVADCTGHGVPGAFMSMLGISFLNEIVRKQEINQANEVLNELRKEIINALQQKGKSGEQKDGMDISLLVVNTETNECQWAGANNPLYIVSSRQEALSSQLPNNCQLSSANYQLYELKGDKMPIAIHLVMSDFTNHQFKAEKGDCFYLFSDGFADQFGGPKGKKFMYKQFKQLLISNYQLTMIKQKEIIEETINKWIGNNGQVDDITVIGLKI